MQVSYGAPRRVTRRQVDHLSVSMGLVSPLDEPEHWERLECHPDRPVRHLSLGNPHSVVGVDDVDAVDLRNLGERVPHINLEIVSPGPEPGAITMRFTNVVLA